MDLTLGDISAVTGPFVAEAAVSRIEPRIRLVGADARGWALLRRTDHLVLDEFGDLWWARIQRDIGTVVRAPWPEEIARLHDDIVRALVVLRSKAAHPAARARR